MNVSMNEMKISDRIEDKWYSQAFKSELVVKWFV